MQQQLNLKLLILLLLSFGNLYAQNNYTLAEPLPNKTVDSLTTSKEYVRAEPYLLYKHRLDSLQKSVTLDWNEQVQSYIDVYVKRKANYEEMHRRAAYYFPIFEKALQQYDVPIEMKYLALVESSLDPHAVSRVGATGLWQFMFSTAQNFGLTMNNFVDERKDPQKASYAAARYLRAAYDELGDWLLAIASYNCGPSNVNRAIEKAGSRNFWELRPFLPAETRNYVPAFIAAVYVMNCSAQHNISIKPSLYDFAIDTIAVNRFVSLDEVANALGQGSATLYALNPSYKKRIVNGKPECPMPLVIPKAELVHFDELYEVLNRDFLTDTTIVLATTDDQRELKKLQKARKPISGSEKNIWHKVKAGQTLSAIARQYKVSVAQLQAWNQLKDNQIVVGQSLMIKSTSG